MTTPKITPEYLAELRKRADAAILTGHHNMIYLSLDSSLAILDHIEKLETMMPRRCDLCNHWHKKNGTYICLVHDKFTGCWDSCDKWQLKDI